MKKQVSLIILLMIVIFGLIFIKIHMVNSEQHQYINNLKIEQSKINQQNIRYTKEKKKIDQDFATKKQELSKLFSQYNNQISLSFYDNQLQQGFNIKGNIPYQNQSLLNLYLCTLVNSSKLSDKSNFITQLLNNNDDINKKVIDKLGGVDKVIQLAKNENQTGLVVRNNQFYVTTNQMLKWWNLIMTNSQYVNIKNKLTNNNISFANKAYYYKGNYIESYVCEVTSKYSFAVIINKNNQLKINCSDIIKSINQILNK